MDSPFFPALIAFGPFFVILFASTVVRRGSEQKPVRTGPVLVAFTIALAIGAVGLIVTLLRA